MSGFPEEWPSGGGGAACRELDSAVRCPICGELFETPLSLRCGHACESGHGSHKRQIVRSFLFAYDANVETLLPLPTSDQLGRPCRTCYLRMCSMSHTCPF